MIPCSGCSRFIRSEVARCPFCDAAQGETPSPVRPALAGVLLGLALTACGGSSTGDEGAGTTTASTTTAGTMSETTASTTMVGNDTDGEEVGTAYGGPGFDTSPPEEETAGGTATEGDSTGTGTGTGTDTGTGTGTGGSTTSGQ